MAGDEAARQDQEDRAGDEELGETVKHSGIGSRAGLRDGGWRKVLGGSMACHPEPHCLSP